MNYPDDGDELSAAETRCAKALRVRRASKIMKDLKSKWQHSVDSGRKLARYVRDSSKVSNEEEQRNKLHGAWLFLTRPDFQSTLKGLRVPFKRVRTQPNTVASSVADGNPNIDAIRGNRLSIWESDVPGTRSLQTREDAGTADEVRRRVLEAIEEAPPPVQPPSHSITAHTGTRFELVSAQRPSAINDLDVVEEVNDADSETNAKQKLVEMDKTLRKLSLRPFKAPRRQYYIPNDVLKSIMTRDAIHEIIPCIARGLTTGQTHELVQDICGRSDQPTRSFRNILVILILIEKADRILEFVTADVTDTKLPLCILGDSESRLFQLCLTGREEAIPLFDDWDPRDIESFEATQWQTLAPFFWREVEGDDRVPSYKLTQHPLPFEIIKESDCTSTGSGKPSSSNATDNSNPSASVQPMNGAHGQVWRVRIARSHHNLQSYRVRYSLPFSFHT